MKKNGFTLVELLGVMTILIIISLLVFPSVKNIINSGKETVYQKQINTILDATYDWSLKNINRLPKNNENTFVTLGELKLNGLVDSNIIDTSTKKAFSDDLVISIKNIGTNYKTKDKYSKKNGDYLFTVEIELMSTDEFMLNKPTIELEGLVANSSGDYVTTIDVNTPFKDANFNALSIDGDDLTSRVMVNIVFNDKLVENVDTSKIGIYKINYTVIDDNGYSTTVIRSVIVTDELGPKLTLPENNTISSTLTSYNLMDGVTCEDNSEKCNITYKGEIEFGEPGKYIIEYTAKDPSGNTTTKKRVITIE